MIEQPPGRKPNRYSQIIEKVFFAHYREGDTHVCFDREEIIQTAAELGVAVPKNVGDVLYTFRHRAPLPGPILAVAPEGKQWVVESRGAARYCFVARLEATILPSPLLATVKIPNATPGVIEAYALNDEQALLAKLRYNRLVDIFTGLACYSLQNHLRTTVRGLGQIETDELYVGLDRRGAHYVLPVQAKGGRDRIGVVQVEQDFAMCNEKYTDLICLPIAAQFMPDAVIALFSFENTPDGVKISSERHYKLVPPAELSGDELQAYIQSRSM